MSLRKCTSLLAGAAKPPSAPPCGVLPRLFHPAGVSVHFLRFIFLHTMLGVTDVSLIIHYHLKKTECKQRCKFFHRKGEACETKSRSNRYGNYLPTRQ